MKRTAILLLVIGCLILSACGSATGNGNSAPTKKISLALIVGTISDPFYTSMSCGARAEANRLGATLNVQGAANWGISDQTPIINAVSTTHPDAMIVVPVDSKAMIPPIKTAAGAGIKIILADTSLDDTSFVSSSVSSANIQLGAAAADTLANLINQQGAVLVLGLDPGASTVVDRNKGFMQELQQKYPNITYLGAPLTTNTTNGDVQQMVAELAHHPNLSGVFSLDDSSAEAAGTAIRQVHKEGSIKVVGFDTSPTEIDMLRKGIVQALIGQKPYEIGVQAVDQAVMAAEGKATTKFIGTGAVSVTLQNLNDPGVSQFLYKTQC
jgi:ribose transport system substrate-binding protein